MELSSTPGPSLTRYKITPHSPSISAGMVDLAFTAGIVLLVSQTQVSCTLDSDRCVNLTGWMDG